MAFLLLFEQSVQAEDVDQHAVRALQRHDASGGVVVNLDGQFEKQGIIGAHLLTRGTQRDEGVSSGVVAATSMIGFGLLRPSGLSPPWYIMHRGDILWIEAT